VIYDPDFPARPDHVELTRAIEQALEIYTYIWRASLS